MKNNTTRRSFVKRLAAGAVAAAILPKASNAHIKTEILPHEPLTGSFGPNDKIRIAGIGMGIMGFGNIRTALKVPGVELVGVCDLYDGHLEHAKEAFGKDIFTTRSYQEILLRKDVDAVFVCTPDHWHDHISIAALNAGKAVYCEKPMVQHIDEGKAVVEAQRKTGKVLQVGSQRVSSVIVAKAKELYQSGAIGELISAEAWMDRQSANGAWQYSIPTDASEKTVDWNRFIGDAPKRGYDPLRFFRWRNYQDYGTGVGGDLFVHLFSGMHQVLDAQGPELIFATGGLRYWKDGRDVPDIQIALMDYPKTASHPAFNLQMRVNLISGDGGSSINRLVGTEGVLEIGWSDVVLRRSKMDPYVGYGGWDTFNTFTEAQQKDYEKWYKEKHPPLPPQIQEPKEQRWLAPEGYDERLDHHRNFFDCVRNGKMPVEDAVFGFRAAAPSLGANISYFEKKLVKWDAVNMVMK
ncbi:MAG: Gfo/Idh/MocA family oxidoreductase [Bacteroidetes bacterium]|nr:Gfo/Idh/MocA family oxidoreductase [Bacteroidota bacterium]